MCVCVESWSAARRSGAVVARRADANVCGLCVDIKAQWTCLGPLLMLLCAMARAIPESRSLGARPTYA